MPMVDGGDLVVGAICDACTGRQGAVGVRPLMVVL